MGPTIILDKSTLQSLSYDEIVCLGNYYLINIAPVLVIEILGDLKKGVDDKKSISKNKVIAIASKIHSKDFVINEHYFNILIGNLLGSKVKMDGRPMMGGGEPVKNKQGKVGIVFKETPENKALNRWKVGRFNEEEKELSQRWRNTTRNLDLERIRDEFKQTTLFKKGLNSFEEVAKEVEKILNDKSIQNDLLKVLMFESLVPATEASQIFMRWEQESFTYLRNFSPYAYFYLKVNLFFYLSLSNNLVGTRSTNRVDLEYLYYLPFTNTFTSGDKFHKKITPYLVNKDQEFIPGRDLKQDLAEINNQLEQDNETESYPSRPPNINGITNKLWDTYMAPPIEGRSEDVLSSMKEEEKQKLLEKLKSFDSENLSEFDDFDSFPDIDDSEVEFVQVETKVRLSDPCPCGSGKPLKDCHYKGKIS